MKKSLIILALFVQISFLGGCSILPTNETRTEGENKVNSSIVSIMSDFSFAKIEDEIASLTINPKVVTFWNKKSKTKKSLTMPRNRECLEITAGNEHFYIYCSDEEEESGFLRIYDKNMQFVNEILLPFKRVSVKNGIVYGYYDEDGEFNSWDSNIANNYIEATHYISEVEFLKNFPNKVSDWITIKEKEKGKIKNQKLYHCLPDYYHKTDYYSERKPLEVLNQIDYIKYCDGKLVSEESNEEVNPRLHQIYSMMRDIEKNFLIRSFEENDKIYGICNVYEQKGELLSLYTKDLKYSFSFSYLENEDRLYKVNEYNNRELIYEDQENSIYHKLDGVYYMDLVTGKSRKIYDYSGEIGITLTKEGLVKIQEKEIHNDEDIEDEYEIIKVW